MSRRPVRSSSIAAASSPEHLAEQARPVLAELQRALDALIHPLRLRGRSGRELARRLGVHATLAWKLLRIATSRDLFADVSYLPGRDGLEKLLAAAADRAVPPASIERCRAAYGAFEALLAHHAGDRASLEQMLMALSDNARVHADSRPFRRAAYRCASATWGMQTRIRLLSKLLHPADDPALMDIALVRGFVGLRRIRRGAPIPLARVVVLDNDGRARRVSPSRPIDPSGVHDGVPLLPRFCSEPRPRIRVAPGPDGVPEQQLADAPVGERAAATIFSGEVQLAAASRYRDEHNLVSNTAVSIRTPIETLVVDLWAHHALFPEAQPRALLFGEACGIPWYTQLAASADRLPMPDPVRTLGPGLARSRLSEFPEYVELMRTVFASLGWSPDEFVLHRLRVEYPVVATAAVLQLDLPARPAS